MFFTKFIHHLHVVIVLYVTLSHFTFVLILAFLELFLLSSTQ